MLMILTEVMKWVSIVVLAVAALWRSVAGDQTVLLTLQLVVCAGALLVAVQARRGNKYLLAAGFIAIALLFNPLAPIALSTKMFLWLNWISLAAFLFSMVVLKKQPALSMPSITKSGAEKRAVVKPQA